MGSSVSLYRLDQSLIMDFERGHKSPWVTFDNIEDVAQEATGPTTNSSPIILAVGKMWEYMIEVLSGERHMSSLRDPWHSYYISSLAWSIAGRETSIYDDRGGHILRYNNIEDVSIIYESLKSLDLDDIINRTIELNLKFGMEIYDKNIEIVLNAVYNLTIFYELAFYNNNAIFSWKI